MAKFLAILETFTSLNVKTKLHILNIYIDIAPTALGKLLLFLP